MVQRQAFFGCDWKLGKHVLMRHVQLQCGANALLTLLAGEELGGGQYAKDEEA